MNTIKTGEGNTEIPEVEEIVIEDDDDVETIRTKVSEYREKVDSRNSQLYARTKKAEGFELVGDKWVKPEVKTEKKSDEKTTSPKDGLTSADVFVLVKANVPEEDIDDVVEYATFKNISVSEALKSSMVQTILADKAEQRKTAEGANTEGGRRGSGRLSDEALLSNSKKGILPESDEDMKRLTILARAR